MIQPLGPDELQKLYQALGIPQRDVDKAEASVTSTDTTLKAKAVIRTWKKRNGKKASVDALCSAKENCRNIQAPKGNNTLLLIVKGYYSKFRYRVLVFRVMNVSISITKHSNHRLSYFFARSWRIIPVQQRSYIHKIGKCYSICTYVRYAHETETELRF